MKGRQLYSDTPMLYEPGFKGGWYELKAHKFKRLPCDIFLFIALILSEFQKNIIKHFFVTIKDK